MTIDKPIYFAPKTLDQIKLASESPGEEAELELNSLLEQFKEWKKENKGTFKDFLKSHQEDARIIKLKDGGLSLKLSRDSLISMLKNEYPVTYLRYMDDLDKMSDDKIKDILNKLGYRDGVLMTLEKGIRAFFPGLQTAEEIKEQAEAKAVIKAKLDQLNVPELKLQAADTPPINLEINLPAETKDDSGLF